MGLSSITFVGISDRMFRILQGFSKYPQQALTSLKLWFLERKHIWITSSGVAAAVLIVRLVGLLQTSELAVFDVLVRARLPESPEDRIVIIGIDEQDLREYGFPVSDAILADLLYIINHAEPRAIGLDLYRGIPMEPGHDEFTQALTNIPNLIGIELLETLKVAAVPPPPALAEIGMIGFNNFVIDSDGRIRRNLLYAGSDDGQTRRSFALQLALIELEYHGIFPTLTDNYEVQFNGVVFPKFQPNDGPYVRADNAGYQVLANFRNPAVGFKTVSLRDVLNGDVPPSLFQNRIVMIGSTAFSVKDFHLTPYSSSLFEEPRFIYGVELHANFLSQILTTILEERPLMSSWSEPVEWLWIIFWSWVGASLSWKLRSPYRSILMIILLSGGIFTGAYLVLLMGWWIPVVPPLITLGASGIVVTTYLAHIQEEFKRSTDFLNSIINTIPDPIYVKTKDHKKMVVNQAYSRLVGFPVEMIFKKSDHDLFPKREADLFYEQDELAFQTNWEQENEEKLTDASGVNHWIATKRSLHKDAAGNLFLVGIIRDITERKKSEETLRQLAEQLEKYNAELQQRADHDPLTGLPNRQLFEERLTQALIWADTNQKFVGLFFLDLNNFKPINDQYGHHVGDLVLKLVAERLRGCLRASDTVSRLGGDEFTIILPGIPSHADAVRVAEKILDQVTQESELDSHVITIGLSIGISLYPLDSQDYETLVQKADAAMYRAKSRHQNSYELTPPVPPNITEA